MPAESAAAAPGVTGAPETTAAPAAATQPSRLDRILKSEGLGGETTENNSTEQSHEQQEKQSGEEQTSEQLLASDRLPEGESGSAGDGAQAGAQQQGGDEEVTEPTEEERKQWPPESLDRIHKLTRQREEWKGKAAKAAELETEVTDLREQLKSAQPVIQAQPTRSDPLADVQTPAQLAAAVQGYEQLVEWATLNPDGATDVVVTDTAGQPLKDAEGNVLKRDYSAQDMAKIRLDADRILRNAVPQRQLYLERHQQFASYAKEVHAPLFKAGTPENQEYQQILQAFPEVTRFPNFPLWIGDAIAGRKAREAAAAEKAKAGTNGNGKAASEELKPFLRKQPPIARTAPISGAPAGAARGSGHAEIDKARERVQSGEGGEEAEVDFVRTLRRSQQPAHGAALV